MPAVAKRYFSKIPGSHFTFPDGTQIYFNYGFYDFKPEDFQGKFSGHKEDQRNGRERADVYQEELEAVINMKGGNPLFYTEESVKKNSMPPLIPNTDPQNPNKPLQNAKSEAEIRDANKGLKGKESGDRNDGQINAGASDVNASSVDHDLRKAVADFDSPIARARAEAAQRAAGAVQTAIKK